VTLSVALVGAGAIAGVHLTALRRVPTVEVVGIFDLDQARARERATCLFGDRKVVDMTHEDTAIAILKFASGVVGEMTATFGIGPGPFDHQVMIHGRDGYLELSSNRGDDNITQPFLLEAIAPKLFGDRARHRVELRPSDGWQTGFVRLWEDYARSLTEGGPTRVTGEDGRKAVAIIRAAYEANASGRVVDLS
jgi:predicted dehydrogenase